jgi:hypothetical protein
MNALNSSTPIRLIAYNAIELIALTVHKVHNSALHVNKISLYI